MRYLIIRSVSLCLLCTTFLSACLSSDRFQDVTAMKPTEVHARSTGWDKTYTITMLDHRYVTPPPPNGTGIRMMNEKFNVDWKPVYLSRDDYEEKMSMTVASGGMPDILIMENPMEPNFYKWAKQGAFLPLDSYIHQYETFKKIPEHALRAATVDGKLYQLPGYWTSTYTVTPMIRKDWLDNLGLTMPANYQELKEVALAFTRKDPDRDGMDDTYGMVMAEGLNPQYHMGAYWDMTAWYHKDKNGNYIPGIISDVRKEHLKWLNDIYQSGALTKNFALINWGQAYKEFFSGKAGIFIGYPVGLGVDNIEAIMEADPKARFAPIPPFKAPDGSIGFTGTPGTYRGIMLNSKLKSEPDKVKRILDIIDFGRTFYPAVERKPGNTDFDWVNGHVGQGYNMVDGIAVLAPHYMGLKPADYFPDLDAWAPNDEANRYADQYKSVPLHYDTLMMFEKMHTDSKHYFGPDIGIYSPARQQFELDLFFKMYDIQTKMVAGQTPFDQWDEMVETFLAEGGAEIIKEVNEKIKETGNVPVWK